MKFLTNIRRQRQYLTISEPISDLDPKVVAAIKAQHQQKSTSQITQPTHTTSTTPTTSASGTSPSGATSSYSSQTVANDTSSTSTSSPLNCIGTKFHPKSSASGSKGSVCVSKDGTHTTTSNTNTNTNTITTSLPNSPNSPNSPILTTPPSKKITHFRSSTTGSNSSGHTPNTEALTPSISEESKRNRIRLDSSTSTSAHRDGTPLTTDPTHHTHHHHHHNDGNYAEGYDDDDNFIIHMSHLQVPFDDVTNGGGGGDMNTGTTHSGGHQGLPPIGSAGTTSSTSKTSIHSQNTSVSSNNSSNHSHNPGHSHNPPQLSSSEEAYLAGQSAGHPILPKNHKGIRLPSPTNLNAKYSSSSPTNSNSGIPTGTNIAAASAAGNGTKNSGKSGKSGKTTSGDNDIMEAGKSSRKGKIKSRNRIMSRKSPAVPKKLPSYMDGDGDGTNNNNNNNDTKHKKYNANSNGGGGGGKVEQREGKATAASSTKKKIGNLFAVGKKKAYKSSAPVPVPVPSPAASTPEVIPEQTPIDLERSGHTSTHRLDLDPSAQTAAQMQLQPPNPPLRRSKSKIKDFNDNQNNNHNNHNDDDNEDEEDDLDKTLNPDILSVVSDITEPTYMNYYDDASTAFFMSTHCKKKFLDVRKKLYESLKARRDAQEQQGQQNAPNNDAHCRRGSWHGMGGTGTGTGANGKDLGKDGVPTPESILELLVDVLCSPQTPPPPPPPPPPLHPSSQEQQLQQQQQQEQSHEQYHNYTSNVPTGMGAAAAVNGAIPPPPPTAIIQVPTTTPKSLPTKEIHLGTNINSNHGVGYNGQPQQHDGGVINRNQLQTRSMSMPDLKNKGIYDNSTPPPPSQYQQPQQQQQSEESAQVPPLPQAHTGTFSSRRYPTKNPTTTTKGVANSKSNGRKMSAHARY